MRLPRRRPRSCSCTTHWAACGCGALLYDRWGSGDSEPLAPPYARDYLRQEALGSLPEVLAQTGVRDAILIGQSDGASIALAYAGAFPALVRGVIALSPHLFVEARTLAAIANQVRDYTEGDLKSRLRRHHGASTEPLFERLVEVWTAKQAGKAGGRSRRSPGCAARCSRSRAKTMSFSR